MKIQDLAQKISKEDTAQLKKLWASRWLKPSQDALFSLWAGYLNKTIKEVLPNGGCGKCRAYLIGRIGLLISEIRKIEHNDNAQY